MATLPSDPHADEDHWAGGPPSHRWPLGRPRRGEEPVQPALIETYYSPGGKAARDAANPALSPDQVPGYHSGTTSESITHETTPLSGPYPGTLPPSKSELYRAQTQAKRRRAV